MLLYFAFLNIIENVKAKVKINANPLVNFTSLKYGGKIIEDVYIDQNYDENIMPNKESLTWVSYEIQRFYVEDIDEVKRRVIVQVRMRGTWIDSRVKTNFSETNRKIILLPSINTRNSPPLWMPFENLIIPHLINRKNINDPIKVTNLKLSSHNSLYLGRFSPNTLLVSASINWRIIMECWPLFKYSDFPHDINFCIIYAFSPFISNDGYFHALFRDSRLREISVNGCNTVYILDDFILIYGRI